MTEKEQEYAITRLEYYRKTLDIAIAQVIEDCGKLHDVIEICEMLEELTKELQEATDRKVYIKKRGRFLKSLPRESDNDGNH